MRTPKKYQFTDVTEVHIFREGDSLVIKPAKGTWLSLTKVNIADADFLIKRADVIEER